MKSLMIVNVVSNSTVVTMSNNCISRDCNCLCKRYRENRMNPGIMEEKFELRENLIIDFLKNTDD